MESPHVIKTFTSKKGNTVELRYPTPDDFQPIWGVACALADEDTYIMMNVRPNEEEEKTWFADMMEKVKNKEAIYILAFVNGAYAGNGRVLRKHMRQSHVGDIGIALSAQFRAEGIGTELMRALIDCARDLGLRLLMLNCFESNSAALHVYEKLGFMRSGVTPGAIQFKDSYVGEVHYYLPLIDTHT